MTLSRWEPENPVPVIKLVVDTLGAALTMRTFDMMAEAYLGGLYIQHMQFKGRYYMK